MSRGHYVAQRSHVVQLFAPVDITGGKTSPAFSMRNWAHVSILIGIGVSAAAPTKIFLNACTDASGSNATAIPFNLFAAETSNLDVLGPRQAVTAAGYSPSANDGIFYVIEIDSTELPSGYAYLQLQVTNGTNSVIASAFAVLSGGRFSGDQSATVLT